jgi:hypothetical protein
MSEKDGFDTTCECVTCRPPTTLRDYFAAQALLGLLGRNDLEVKGGGKVTEPIFAEQAYILADAMLKERSK